MRNKVVLILVGLFLFSALAVAQAVPSGIQVKLILKIISMDRNFARYGDPVAIGVSSDKIASEFSALAGKVKVKGKDFTVTKMGSLDDISKYKILYIDDNWKNNYAPAAVAAKGSQSLIFCAEEDYVVSGGGAVSFKVVSGKPKIVLNLGNVKEQGSDFPANFLKITVVVGGL